MNNEYKIKRLLEKYELQVQHMDKIKEGAYEVMCKRIQSNTYCLYRVYLYKDMACIKGVNEYNEKLLED